MSRLRPWLVLVLFVTVTLPLMPLQQLFLWIWPNGARWLPVHYHRLLCRILGVRVETIGAAPW